MLWIVLFLAVCGRWVHHMDLRENLLWSLEWTHSGQGLQALLPQGIAPLHVMALQLIVGVVVALSIARLGQLFGGAFVGLLAGTVYALYGPAILAESSAHWIVWQTALVLLATLLLATREQAVLPGIALGLACGLSGAVWPIALAVGAWIGRERPTALPLLALGLIGGIAIALVATGANGIWPRLPWEWFVGARQFVRAAEVTDRIDPYVLVEGWRLSQLMWHQIVGVPFGLLAPLGLWGLWQVGRLAPISPERSLFLSVAWAAVVGAMICGGGPWERLVAVPFLALAAGWGWMLMVARRCKRAVWSGLLVVCVLAGIGHADPRPDWNMGTAATLQTRGRAYETLSMPANAIEAYERAVAAGSTAPEIHEKLGALYMASGEYARAAAAYQQALAVDANDVTRLQLAQAYLLYERPLQAIEQYDILLRDSNRTDMLGLIGDARLMLGQIEEAQSAYEQMVEQAPDSARVQYNLARLYQEQGREGDALAAYAQLRDRQAWRVEASWRAASLLLGRTPAPYEEAEELLADALAADPDNEQVRWLWGRALIGLERFADAVGVYENLRAINAEDYRPHFFLAKLYYRLGKKDEADAAYAAYQTLKRQMEVKQSVEEDLNAVLRQLGE